MIYPLMQTSKLESSGLVSPALAIDTSQIDQKFELEGLLSEDLFQRRSGNNSKTEEEQLLKKAPAELIHYVAKDMAGQSNLNEPAIIVGKGDSQPQSQRLSIASGTQVLSVQPLQNPEVLKYNNNHFAIQDSHSGLLDDPLHLTSMMSSECDRQAKQYMDKIHGKLERVKEMYS